MHFNCVRYRLIIVPSNLSAISTQCHDLVLRSPLRRYFTAADDAAKLSRILRELEHLVRMFQVSWPEFVAMAHYLITLALA